MISSSSKENKEKSTTITIQQYLITIHHPTNSLILPEMDSNRTALPCLLKGQKGSEHLNMLNHLFTIIHSRLRETGNIKSTANDPAISDRVRTLRFSGRLLKITSLIGDMLVALY